MGHIKLFFKLFFQELGFSDIDNFFKQVFFINKSIFIYVQSAGAIISILFAFTKDWIWDPPSGAVIFIILVLIESMTSTMVAIRVHKEKFNYIKFYSIAPKLLSHLMLLSLSFNIGNHSLLLAWLPNACFGWFAARNFLTISINLIELNMVKGEFAEFVKQKLAVKDKEMADTINQKEERNEKVNQTT